MSTPTTDLAARYFIAGAAAYVRGKIPDAPQMSDEELVRYGLERNLRIDRFKRSTELPRVRKVLGILRGLSPSSVLDVGSGRGVFLWPLVDALPALPIIAIDEKQHRIEDIQAVTAGGLSQITAKEMDVCNLDLEDGTIDVITILEVLEHLPRPQKAAAEVVRVARRFIIASVPSKEDNNPEHIQLFTKGSLAELFLNAGAASVKCEYVLNHMIAVVKVTS